MAFYGGSTAFTWRITGRVLQVYKVIGAVVLVRLAICFECRGQRPLGIL
jgi:hypothetical protein